MKGRKPKPTHLKVVAGNPGKRELNLAEPKPEGNLDAAPEWFSAEQVAAWTYAIDHAPGDLLKRLDRSTLTIWVVAECLHREATLAVGKVGLLTKTPNGAVVQNPYLPIINKQAALMLKAAAEMGFTPASRSRINLDPGGSAGANPFSALG